jgi:hypothetical protein
LPQGSPKKIQFHLLLADLALQVADAPTRRREILVRLKVENPEALARTTGRPQRLRSPSPEMLAPLV